MTISSTQEAVFGAIASALSPLVLSGSNIAATTEKAKPWGRVTWLPSPVSVATLGPAGVGTDELVAIAQVDVWYQEGTGDSAARAHLEALRANIRAGDRLGDGVVVSVSGAPLTQDTGALRAQFDVRLELRVPR